MAPVNINLRAATVEDAPLLHYWDTKAHVIACAPNETHNWIEEINNDSEWQQHLIAELDGQPIGVMQIIDPYNEVTHYWGDIEPNLRAIDIWIGEERHLANGYGTEMMRQAIDLCFALPAVTAIIIDPLSNNLRAINFYRKLGFRNWYEGDFEEDHCLVMRLERTNY